MHGEGRRGRDRRTRGEAARADRSRPGRPDDLVHARARAARPLALARGDRRVRPRASRATRATRLRTAISAARCSKRARWPRPRACCAARWTSRARAEICRPGARWRRSCAAPRRSWACPRQAARAAAPPTPSAPAPKRVENAEAKALYRRGFEHFANDRHDEAIALYEQALNLDPALAIAWNGLSLAHRQKGDLEAAIVAGRRLIELEPDDALSHTNLSILYQRRGMIPEAEEEKAIAMQIQMKQQARARR